MSDPKSTFYLVHSETGQRYSVKGSVTIGRSHADIVFPRDAKLSSRHCEVTPVARGLAVKDLNSANGTRINGKNLAPNRTYMLGQDSELSVGEQAFTFQAVSIERKLKKRGSKRRSRGSESFSLVYLIVIAAILIFAWKNRSFDRLSPLQLSQKQLGEIFEDYQSLQMSLERQTVPPRDVASQIQGRVLEHLGAISRRWADFQPQDDEQRRHFSELLQFAGALSGHAKTQLLYINSGDLKYLEDMDQWIDQVDQAANELHRESGAGYGPPFPTLLQSPLQIVEREMRKVLHEYKKLGNAVQNHEVSEAEMGQRIRQELTPKLTSVYSNMGAIVPQNDFERRKLVLEQKLMTAFIGQIKYLSLYTESKDKKYAEEMDHWTAEVERLNKELKSQLNPSRLPANR